MHQTLLVDICQGMQKLVCYPKLQSTLGIYLQYLQHFPAAQIESDRTDTTLHAAQDGSDLLNPAQEGSCAEPVVEVSKDVRPDEVCSFL